MGIFSKGDISDRDILRILDWGLRPISEAAHYSPARRMALMRKKASPSSRCGAPGDILCSARVWHRMWWGGQGRRWRGEKDAYTTQLSRNSNATILPIYIREMPSPIGVPINKVIKNNVHMPHELYQRSEVSSNRRKRRICHAQVTPRPRPGSPNQTERNALPNRGSYKK